jgi:hypothetical protein
MTHLFTQESLHHLLSLLYATPFYGGGFVKGNRRRDNSFLAPPELAIAAMQPLILKPQANSIGLSGETA